MITDPVQAEHILNSGQADMVALAREFLRNPRWVWQAAQRLGGSSSVPPQYLRAQSFFLGATFPANHAGIAHWLGHPGKSGQLASYFSREKMCNGWFL